MSSYTALLTAHVSQGPLKLRRLIGLVVALVLGFCAVAGVTLVELRQDSWNTNVSSAENLLVAVTEDIVRNVELYDLSLQAVIQGLQLPGLNDVNPEMRRAVLFDRAATARYLGAILIINEHGDVVEDSGATPPRRDNFSDREYFRAHQTQVDAGLFISRPFRRRLTGPGDLVVALSRRLNHPDGSFAGVVVGTLKLDYFKELFNRFNLGEQGAVNLFSANGVVLMRAPYDEDSIDRDLSGTSNVRRFMVQASGRFSGFSAIDNVKRIYVFTHVGTLPLILNVALSEADIYQVWHIRAAVIGAVLLALCAGASGLGLLLTRELRHRARAEAETRTSEAQYRLLADHATDVIVRLDCDLMRRYVSPASLAVFGYLPAELVGSHPREAVQPDDWARVVEMVDAARRNQDNIEVIYRFRHKAGHYVWVEAQYSYMPKDGGFIVVLRNISKRKQTEEQLDVANAELVLLATTDGLTGLANRRQFDEKLDQEWRRAGRDQTPLSLLLLDVDRFKLYNDRYGHQAGDECLRMVARAVAGCAQRPADLAARYGGEELAVLLPGTDEAGAAMLGERVRAAVAALELRHEGNAAHGEVVTVSIGTAVVMPWGGAADSNSKELVAAADRAMYEAKRTGRNCVMTQHDLPTSPIPPVPADEEARLTMLATYQEAGVANHAESLDRIARLAAGLLGAPMAFVSLISKDEQFMAGRFGLDIESTCRDISFCSHAITSKEPLIVTDTHADPRFAENPLVIGKPGIRFYAGAPMISPQGGHNIGVLCIADHSLHLPLNAAQRMLLTDFAALAVDDMERRRLEAGSRSASPPGKD